MRRLATSVLVAVALGAARCLRVLPEAWAARFGRALGWAWYRLVPVRRGVARANVRRALGAELGERDREALVAEMYAHLGQSFVEFLRGSREDARGVGARLRIEGREHLEAALADRRGVLVLAAHLGNWELLVRGGGTAFGRPVSVVTKRLSAGPAEAAWRALRRGGVGLLAAAGSARAVLAALARNEIVVYVLDQSAPSPRAVFVPFFGHSAATSPDLARLARISGAPVLPVFTWREGDRHRVEVRRPVPLPETADRRAGEREATARFTAEIEDAIRRAPAQWLWIHRRWKRAPPSGPAEPR